MNNRKDMHIEVRAIIFFRITHLYKVQTAVYFSHVHLIWEALVYLLEGLGDGEEGL